MGLTFCLLGLAILAVWCPTFRASRRIEVTPWILFFLGSTLSAWISGVIATTGVLVLLLFALLCLASTRFVSSWTRRLAAGLVCAYALGLALRLFPGFSDYLIFDRILLSPEAAPFRLNLNFGKGCAGLFLLALYSKKITSWREANIIFNSKIWVIALGTPFLVLTTAVAFGGIRFDPKWPEPAMTFLAANLLFTCVAEEAFFRGFLQERLHQVFGTGPIKRWLPIALISIIFAALHLNASWVSFMFVAIAGLGYSSAYFMFRRIEPAIITHYLVNSLHFLFFTYPYIAKAA